MIRRYGNRRLYDPQLSRAVTIEEIAEAVRGGEDVRVVDADTGNDITRRIFFQIILEEQNRASLDLVPVELLRLLIVTRSEPLGRWLEQYLASGAQLLGQMAARGTGPGMPAMPGLEEVGRLFSWMQPSFATAGATTGAGTWRPTAPPAAPPPGSHGGSHGVGHGQTGARGDADLRDEVAEMQRRIAELDAKLGRR